MADRSPARIAIFGGGYVGLVTGACFAELGHDVVVRDVVAARIEQLQRGEVPIYEPGLAEVLERNRERLRFTLDVREAIEGAEFLYVAVGTPPTPSGDADLSAVWTVVAEVPDDTRVTIVMKSTVPVGTGAKVRATLDARGLEHVGYVSNPEFTAEGTAVRDFMQPDRIVIGSFEEADGEAVARLHAAIDAPVLRMDVASAEMVKLASNAFLSTRISFVNEIANVCEAVGADVEQVANGMGLDHRLGPHFLRAGIGFGGSCLAGSESVLVRARGRTRLTTLEALFDETQIGEPVEILTWRPDGDGPEFRAIELLTRREYEGDLVEVRTKMGRRVSCTPDHLFVTQDGRKQAQELTTGDWLPVAQGAAALAARSPRLLNVVAAFEDAGLTPERVIVRPHPDELAVVSVPELQAAAAVAGHPRGRVARSHDIRRSGALRLHEAAELDVELETASFGTAKNGTYVPAAIEADSAFWRVVGLYLAEGHSTYEPGTGRRRLEWSFHPRDESALVDEVRGYWQARGVKATTFRARTAHVVRVSSRLLAAWWLEVLGLGSTCYEQRLPDLVWDQPEEHKRALLAGLWLGDGSWSYVGHGPSVVLEYGTVSRELADGVLRLLGELGVVARLKVGRTRKSTVDTYWLVVSGAEQVERLLDLFPAVEAGTIRASLGQQAKRIRPTGYRRRHNTAWVRIVDVVRRPFRGFVYSLEVPPTHTFVTTGGLVTSNCFPKDVSALKQLAGNSGYHFQLLSAVIEVNELQKRRVVRKLQRYLGPLRGTTIALLGLAFKPNTDDMREAPSIVLASRLLSEGAAVRGWDPVADAGAILPQVTLCSSPLEAVRDADAAVIVTEWPELKSLPRPEIRDAMRRPLIVDGRNLLDPQAVRSAGFVYEGIGRLDVESEAVPEAGNLLQAR
jgi:UDPglucose 6-dehydrogenase